MTVPKLSLERHYVTIVTSVILALVGLMFKAQIEDAKTAAATLAVIETRLAVFDERLLAATSDRYPGEAALKDLALRDQMIRALAARLDLVEREPKK